MILIGLLVGALLVFGIAEIGRVEIAKKQLLVTVALKRCPAHNWVYDTTEKLFCKWCNKRPNEIN